jgi:hypothetical protein
MVSYHLPDYESNTQARITDCTYLHFVPRIASIKRRLARPIHSLCNKILSTTKHYYSSNRGVLFQTNVGRYPRSTRLRVVHVKSSWYTVETYTKLKELTHQFKRAKRGTAEFNFSRRRYQHIHLSMNRQHANSETAVSNCSQLITIFPMLIKGFFKSFRLIHSMGEYYFMNSLAWTVTSFIRLRN